ncbi:MAG: pyruvate kinase, partial [Candidatus Acidiferrum sp.]
LEELIQNLNLLLSAMAELETSGLIGAAEVHLDHRASARNLLDYLALRRYDIRPLQSKLARLGFSSLGRIDSSLHVVLKVLHKLAGSDPLTPVSIAAPQVGESRAVGVMIARGDLSVECGYQRLAEVQEEILWVCEAAHMPVIWATQVLESLAKNGIPSRAEITDATMGERAECVMLNKGPYIVTAVRILGDILRRMQPHHEKKNSLLRKLHLAVAFHAGA